MRGSLLLIAHLVAAAHAQSPPLQQVKPGHSKPLAGLLESAKGFLANGATPDTVTFVEETLQQVKDIIIPAIVSESEKDMEWLKKEHQKFADAKQDWEEDVWAINLLRHNVQSTSKQHQKCRKYEKRKCEGKRVCEMRLHELWEEWSKNETELKLDHKDFDDHFCVGKNGTLSTFRDDSVTPMNEWRSTYLKCDKAAQVYAAQVPLCDDANEELDKKTQKCNTDMNDLQAKACEEAAKYNSAITKWHTDWAAYHASYQGVTDLIYQQTQDRKQEHKTLKIVQCLLKRVHQQNGVPCDSSTDVTNQVKTCDDEGKNLDPCLVCAADEVDGDCTEDKKNICPVYEAPGTNPIIPDPLPHPCSKAWTSAQMDTLPVQKWKETPLSAKNPGCNTYPECESCVDLKPFDTKLLDYLPGRLWVPPTVSFGVDEDADYYDATSNPSGAAHATFNDEAATYAQTNSLRASTFPGCGTEANDENGDKVGLQTKYADDTAAVRCCSKSGDACVTPGANGDGKADDECSPYTSVTFHDALAVCDHLGMVLCAHDQMGKDNQCCGTGCGFNDKHVWISDTVA